jgi:hypothetical protein
VFPELAALQIQKKLLRLAQLGCMNPEQEVSLIGKPSQQIQIDCHMLSMLFHHTLERRQTEDPSRRVLLRPLLIKREDGKRAVDSWIVKKFLSIGPGMGRR